MKDTELEKDIKEIKEILKKIQEDEIKEIQEILKKLQEDTNRPENSVLNYPTTYQYSPELSFPFSAPPTQATNYWEEHRCQEN